MSDLFVRLLFLFPDYKDGDWILVQDPSGATRVAKWNRDAPPPTERELRHVTERQLAMARRIMSLPKIFRRAQFLEMTGDTGELARIRAEFAELREQFGDRLLERKTLG